MQIKFHYTDRQGGESVNTAVKNRVHPVQRYLNKQFRGRNSDKKSRM